MHTNPSAEVKSPVGLTREVDVETVIATLGVLMHRVDSPVIKECLRDARAEIAFLMSSEGNLEDFESDEYLAKQSVLTAPDTESETDLDVA